MSQQRRPERMKPLGTHAPSRARTRGRVRTQIFGGYLCQMEIESPIRA
jgi:hypothetical protein